jgi:hypothetical protein
LGSLKSPGYLALTQALCLFHDRFPAFLESLETDHLETGKSEDVAAILEQLKVNPQQNLEEVYQKFDSSEGRIEWDQSVFKFLLETEVFKSYP